MNHLFPGLELGSPTRDALEAYGGRSNIRVDDRPGPVIYEALPEFSFGRWTARRSE